ncbi:MAG: hypothetical protein ACD_13C00022G0012 [uncultured bacterium]|nr:MAG: hypothetical protein ACD_13C00022G0012 [uncultured bacterium]KKR53253.1 MAG: Acyltransferase [Candidatus Woesebacteria bacterium GW2011_GWD2_40_19]KKR58092.1 MAG: Acyltransferase [Candidatus Woesebacteria bacterium GW2011_GWC2_40_30]HAU64974.1 hypothetical protein [Candidatus Woesebacteria bacterium]HCC08834.1 hypothetical protein [Candidatus Woesebacteria bacterium]
MKERIKSLDSLRTIAILAVLLIHTTTRTLEASKFNIIGFSWTLFLNQIARFAVPLFFTLSGFVLELNYKEGTDYWSFIKKRFSKIFIPYAVWSLIYYLFIYSSNDDNFLRVILTGNASYQLYFIPTLCIFYMVFPLLHKLYKYFTKLPVLIFLGSLQIYLLYLDYGVAEFKFPDPLHIAILAYFFFIIGIVSARNKEKINIFVNKWKHILPVITALLGLFVFWEGRTRFLATGNYLSYYSQWRPSTFLYTISIGLTLYYFFENTKNRNSIIERFSKHSFFVFFVHVAVLEGVWTAFAKSLFNLLGSDVAGKFLFDPLFFGVVTSLSFGLSYLVHKIPGAEKVMG